MNLPRQVTGRLLLMGAVLGAFVLAWHHTSAIPLLVIGQPRAVGLLQRDQEAPFFRQLAATTGLPLQITYRPTDSFGLKDTHQLDALREGRIDIVSLRFMQNIPKEPTLEGLDLPGMIPDFTTARRVLHAYAPTVERHLQRNFGAKLLGIWSFGPQVMVCRSPLAGLRDIRGRTVRVASPGLARLLGALGAIPAVMPFEDTKAALAAGIVDCAVTSAASASFAGWTQHSTHYYPLSFQFGFNGYAISLKRWQSLSPDQRQRLETAFRQYNDRLWRYSQTLQKQSEACIIGGSCQLLPSQRLIRVEPSREDVRLLQEISRRIVLPSWSERCERRHPGCRQDWQRRVAPLTTFFPDDQRQL